jgi:hypothetical protein
MTKVAEVKGQLSLFDELQGNTAEVGSYLPEGRLDHLEKDSLVGVPFIITEARIREGKGGLYVFLHVLTKDGREGYVSDGGTGIPPVVDKWLSSGDSQYLLASKGLRRSDYEATEDRPEGTTYYFA